MTGSDRISSDQVETILMAAFHVASIIDPPDKGSVGGSRDSPPSD
jgi:hypothetical protein